MKRRIAYVLDRSGSMKPYIDTVIELVNKGSADVRKDVEFSVILFDDVVETIVKNSSGKINITAKDYYARGSTTLRDGVMAAINEIGGADSHTVITLTDGFENASRTRQDDFEQALQVAQASDKWTFAFLVPPGGKVAGVPKGNIQEWTDINQARDVTVAATVAHVNSGKRSTKNFFTTDLSNLKKRDLKKLQDVTSEVKVLTLSKESRIDDFVKSKNKGVYTSGTAFYQLTKKERAVQDYKKIYFDGRELLGLPDMGDVKLEPGNHAGYDVFIESQSQNRKLVRGSLVALWPGAINVSQTV